MVHVWDSADKEGKEGKKGAETVIVLAQSVKSGYSGNGRYGTRGPQIAGPYTFSDRGEV